MGVGGAVGFIRKYGASFAQPIELSNQKLILDLTEALYWVVKDHLLSGGRRADLMGTDFVALCAFYRHFIKRLLDHQVRLVVVYSGGRAGEQHGQLASKSHHLTLSCRGQLQALARGQARICLPTLANNAVKEVIREFLGGLEAVRQSPYEVYPLLQELAGIHKCPVMTSHSDFIFTDGLVDFGHIWLGDLSIPNDPSRPMTSLAYSHSRMLDSFNIPTSCGPALRSIYCLMRDDFASVHCDAVNRLLKLSGDLAFRRRPSNVRTRRLAHVMQHWPNWFTSVKIVRGELLKSGSGSVDLGRDFDAIMETFIYNGEISRVLDVGFPSGEVDLMEATVRAEATADFIMSLRNTDFNRSPLEDFRTFRSTFSLQDRVKQYLLDRIGARSLKLFDRSHDTMRYRTLEPLQAPQERLTCESLFRLFHFDNETLDNVCQRLQYLQMDANNCRQLALLLLLARFGFKLALRDTYDNEDLSGQGLGHQPGSTTSSSQGRQQAALLAEYLSEDFRSKFFVALINSFAFQRIHQTQGDTSPSEMPADIRVARSRLISLVNEGVSFHDVSSEAYIRPKHSIEMLNSTLRAYKELNSLYNFVGPNILVGRYYNGVLIYKIMRKFSANMAGMLLQLDKNLFDILNS